MQQDCELVGDSHHGASFAVRSAAFGPFETPISQLGIRAKGAQNVLGASDQKSAQITVACLGDPKLPMGCGEVVGAGVVVPELERSGVGGQCGVTERIENYPGFAEGVGGAQLADAMRAQAEGFGVEILQAQAVTKIDTQDDYKMVATEGGDEYCSKAVLLAPGSTYRRLNVPGEDDFIGAGIHFCATCDGPFYKGQELLVVGGGNSGVEEGLFLTKFASKVTVL